MFRVFLLFLVFSFLAAPCLYAEGPEWEERERHWLLSLTYPDWGPGDFGVETGEADRRLLERFKPRVIVSPEGLLPVDFYGFYLPRTVVRDLSRAGEVAKKSPSREFLKGIEREKRYHLDYNGPMYPCEGSVCEGYRGAGYATVTREVARLRTGGAAREVPIVVLKYNFVFPYSGVPAGLGLLKELGVRLVADPVKFHELDIHGSVQVILNSSGTPMVLLLAQHNHFRTFVIGKDVELPADNRIPVCFAERSNEPYTCPAGAGPELHRAVGNPMYMPYVIDGRNRPLFSGKDRVFGLKGGGKEVEYVLRFPPTRDPLYVSWIPLGDRQKILFFDTFYRKGPPGMDLNTWPEVKTYGEIMQFWYLRDASTEDAELLERCIRSFIDVDFAPVLEKNGGRLFKDLVRMGYIEE